MGEFLRIQNQDNKRTRQYGVNLAILITTVLCTLITKYIVLRNQCQKSVLNGFSIKKSEYISKTN